MAGLRPVKTTGVNNLVVLPSEAKNANSNANVV